MKKHKKTLLYNEKSSKNEDDYEYKRIRQELQIEDLYRYGIFMHLVDDFNEITEILQILVDRYRRRIIFISGSAFNYSDYSDEDAHAFIHKFSYELAKNNYRIVNGYGKGVGEFVLNGVAEYCLANNSKINELLTLVPFPQNSSLGINLDELYLKNREQLIENCGIAVFLFGNKETEAIARGVMDEFELSKKLGLACLPIGYTGGAAKEIYNKVLYESSDEELQAIKHANEQCDRNIDESVNNILNAIKMLSKERI